MLVLARQSRAVDLWAMTNDQCPITNECPIPNDECHDRPSSREWGPGTAEASSGLATSTGKQRRLPQASAIGHWVLVIHWSLVIGHWSLAVGRHRRGRDCGFLFEAGS